MFYKNVLIVFSNETLKFVKVLSNILCCDFGMDNGYTNWRSLFTCSKRPFRRTGFYPSNLSNLKSSTWLERNRTSKITTSFLICIL